MGRHKGTPLLVAGSGKLLVPKIINGIQEDFPIIVGSEHWFNWLEQNQKFYYQLKANFARPKDFGFSCRKESLKRGQGYWYVYKKIGNKIHKPYLGKSSSLNSYSLRAEARKIYSVYIDKLNIERDESRLVRPPHDHPNMPE